VAFGIANVRGVETPCDREQDGKDARYCDKRLSRAAQDSRGKEQPDRPADGDDSPRMVDDAS